MFGTKQVPAVGVSLGIERVFAIMEQLHKDHNQVTRITDASMIDEPVTWLNLKKLSLGDL